MIVMRLMGGLGNQMFQYALGRHLAVKFRAELRLDHSVLSKAESPRQYELAGFEVAAKRATSGDVRRLSQNYPRGMAGMAQKASHWFRFGQRRTHLIEETLEFAPGVLTCGDDVLLEGYWQSARYFEAIEDVIRRDFSLRDPLPEPAASMVARLRSEESVCVHVRRGDYVTNPRAAVVHGTCDLAYYQRAATQVASQVRNAKFYVFSDDMAWVRQHFELPVPFECLTSGSERADVELCVMASCRHFAIANSSYSWWAAWLADSARKIVVAPKKWANDVALNTASRFPRDWIPV